MIGTQIALYAPPLAVRAIKLLVSSTILVTLKILLVVNSG
jgi:hypothetical protein